MLNGGAAFLISGACFLKVAKSPNYSEGLYNLVREVKDNRE